MQMNSAAVSSISATINGEAVILEPGTDEEKWCREQHLANNTFTEGVGQSVSSQLLGTSPGRGGEDGGRESYIEGEDVRVVVVRIKDGRISDWKGGVKDWVVTEDEQNITQQDNRTGRLVNACVTSVDELNVTTWALMCVQNNSAVPACTDVP
nr:pyridoxamine 5'-phosphate oxidase like [Quercus suber]